MGLEKALMNAKLKVYLCSKHPNEIIKYITTNEDSSPYIFCTKCVQHQQNASPKNLLPLEEYLSHAAEKYRQLKTSQNSSLLPDAVKEFIENEKRWQMEHQLYIEDQKIRIKDMYEAMITEITSTLYAKRNSAINQLETRVHDLEVNGEQISSLIQELYEKSTPEIYFDKSQLIERMNSCEDPHRFEAFIRDTNKQLLVLSQAKHVDTALNTRKKALDFTIAEFRHCLNTQRTIPLLMRWNDLLHDQLQHLYTLLDKLGSVASDSEGISLLGPLSSLIPLSKDEKQQISKWITPAAEVNVQLVYRGTRDGFAASCFHEKCNGAAPTLILCKSEYGKVFGGFTEQAWESTKPEDLDFATGTSSARAFLFSVSHKQKYPQKTLQNSNDDVFSNTYSLHTTGPCFGQGDLSIPSHCNLEKAASRLGVSYWTPEGANKLEQFGYLGGAQSFKIEEIEVYLVLYDRSTQIRDEIPDECRNSSPSNSNKDFTPY